MRFNPQTSVTQLAKLIVINCVHLWPSWWYPWWWWCLHLCYWAVDTRHPMAWFPWFYQGGGWGTNSELLLIIFKVTWHYNYAKEAVNLLLHYHLLSDRQKAQLLWSRYVNTRGVAGLNIPGDLHYEHLNSRLKSIIAGQRANVIPDSIVKAGKAAYLSIIIFANCLKIKQASIFIPISTKFDKDFDK